MWRIICEMAGVMVDDWNNHEWLGVFLGAAFFALILLIVFILIALPFGIAHDIERAAICERATCPAGATPTMTRRDGCVCIVRPVGSVE